MNPERITAAHAMRARGMTLIQIAATLGVGRSFLVRALAQAPPTPADPEDTSTPDGQTVLQLPKPAVHSTDPAPSSAAELAAPPGVQLLGRTGRRGGEELEALDWSAGHSPACPSCTRPTTGVEEQDARVRGQRKPVIVALTRPCGCPVNEHVIALMAASPTA